MLLRYHTRFFLTLAIMILFSAMFITSCKKKDDNPFIFSPQNDLTSKVRSSVSGFVADENGLAVNFATVQVGAVTVTTDFYGYFEIKDVDVVKNAAVVTITKAGYFKGIKTYIASEGKAVFFRIKLIKKTIAGSVNSITGGLVTLLNGLSISLPANAVVNTSSNAAYTGTVNISAYWLNPTSNDLTNTMPGDLRGINTEGNLQLLTTYGMAAVELTGSGGELLQIASGKKATLNFPIPTSLGSTAPASIPLWYFDEAKGLWKEEGKATKSGSNYIGDVSHLSFWNVDIPVNYVQLNCTVVNTSGQPIQYTVVRIKEVANPANTRYGVTDINGYVEGPVPGNAQLQVDVLSDLPCNFVIYSQIITTGNTNISLGNIVINNSFVSNVSGTITTCANTPVPNGFIIINTGNHFYRYPVINGAYSYNTLLCSPPVNISIIAEDPVNGQQNTPVTYQINQGNNIIPNIQACGINALQFINYTVNGTPYSYTYPIDHLSCIRDNNFMFFVNAWRLPSGTEKLDMLLVGGNTGTLSLQGLRLPQIPGDLVVTPPRTVAITEYPSSVGDFLAGNFTETFTGMPPNPGPYNVTCSFRIRRTQ